MEANLQFPHTGGSLEDRAILRNAVQFSTPQRARRALETLSQTSFQHLGNRQRAMLAFEGFQAMMVSLEDLQALLFVLRDWQPGTSEGSLFALLDKVQVGRQRGDADWRAEVALEFLGSLTPGTYRELVRLPAAEELLAAGWSKELVENVAKSMESQLDLFLSHVHRQGCLWLAKRKIEMKVFPSAFRRL